MKANFCLAIRVVIIVSLFMCSLGGSVTWAQHDTGSKQGQKLTMDFVDVDLRSVIRFVAEMTGKNFVVDEKLKGKVTVVTPQGVSVDEAFQIFESILSVYNFKIIESGSIYKIIPDTTAREEGTPFSGSGEVSDAEDRLVSSLFQLQHADVNVLVPLLKPMMHGWGAIGAYIPNNSLIITDSAATIKKLDVIIKSLDVPREVGAWKFIPLQNGNAVQVEKVLNSVYADYNSMQPKGAVGVKVFSDSRINTLLVLAAPERLAEVGRMVENLDVRAEVGSGNLHLYYPKNAKADIIATVINDLIGKASGGGTADQPATFSKSISVVGEVSTNTLVISALPQDYEMLLPIIEGLDIRRLQVYVEALVMEISASRGAEFGIEWRSMESLSDNRVTAFGGTSFGTATSINNVAANPLAAPSGMALGLVKGTVTFGDQQFLNLGALVRALQSDSDVNILATPNILVLDNEQAEILVGQNVPFRSGSNTGTTTATTYERKDIGLKLQITPQILEGGKVRLAVYQEQSNLAPTITIGAGDEEIVTDKRSIQTTVMLDNGHTVVLGGLISDESRDSVSMVPCIGSVFGVGELFKNTNRSRSKRNLMVFLRPVIINTYDELLSISSGKYDTIRRDWGQSSPAGSDLIPDISKSPLPEALPGNE